MRIIISTFNLLVIALVLVQSSAFAQDNRSQYPKFLSRSYIGLNMGYIDYDFTSLQLEPGYQVKNIRVPHLALQVLLLGHHITENLSAQITYTRPVKWVEYESLNGDQHIHYVRMNISRADGQIPITRSPRNSQRSEKGD